MRRRLGLLLIAVLLLPIETKSSNVCRTYSYNITEISTLKTGDLLIVWDSKKRVIAECFITLSNSLCQQSPDRDKWKEESGSLFLILSSCNISVSDKFDASFNGAEPFLKNFSLVEVPQTSAPLDLKDYGTTVQTEPTSITNIAEGRTKVPAKAVVIIILLFVAAALTGILWILWIKFLTHINLMRMCCNQTPHQQQDIEMQKQKFLPDQGHV